MTLKPKIIIFGGSGFIGSHLIARIQSEAKYDVIIIDIAEPKIRIAGAAYLLGDVRNLNDLEIEGKVEKIYNLAAIHTTPGHQPHEYYDTNVSGATEVCAFARRAGVKQIIFTSSISVYGPAEDTKSESSIPNPQSSYGWSKWLAEGIYRSWQAELPDRQLVVCRPAVIFGRGEGGNFTRLARLLKKGLFIYPGRKDTVKACFYVQDLVDSIIFAQSLKTNYVLFNGSYANKYTIEQIVKEIKTQSFPNAREIMLPKWVMILGAKILTPFSLFGLGIHPERILKLARSTDIHPNWLIEQGHLKAHGLKSAVERWKLDTAGRFD
jgi:GlcNAc-P-P-Und epimerase